MKKKKYNDGGMLQQILPSLLGLIPGGNIVNAALPLINQLGNTQPKVYEPRPMSNNPFGMAFGGPILPITPMVQESTYVQPQPFLPQLPIAPPITDYRLTDQYQNQQMRAANTFNPVTGLGMYDANGGSGKVKSKDRFREKAMGGKINDGFVQYKSGSHASGNDTEIDQYGNPVSVGVASIQNKENMFNGFIYSDTLKNPETGNKFNKDAMKINKKYPNARLSDIDDSSLKFEMGRLAKINQNKIDEKQIIEEPQMAYGGYINPPQIPYGDPMEAYNEAWQFNYGENPNAIQPIGLDNTQMQSGQILTDRSVTQQLPTLNLRSGVNSTNNILPLSLNQAYANTPVVEQPGSTMNQTSGTTERSGLGTLDAIGLGLKGAALVGSISDALTPALKEQLILPDYAKADQYMQEANIDYSQAKQDALGVSNIASNNIRSMSGNAGQYMSRQSGRLAQLQDVVSRISEQQNNAQSQLNLTKGQYEANKAVDNANRKYQNNIDNLQNTATSNTFDRSLMADLSQIGTQFGQEARAQEAIANNKDLTNFTNSQIISALNSKYGNFQLNDDIINQFKSGKIGIDELLKFKI